MKLRKAQTPDRGLKTAAAQREGRPASLSSRSGVWSLQRDGVTSSSLAKFAACREQFRLSYVEGWTSLSPSYPIAYGNVVHACLEWAYGRKQAPDANALETWFRGYEKTWDAWKHPIRKTPLSADTQQLREETLGAAQTVLAVYFKHCRGDWLNKWLFAEREFNFELLTERGNVRVRGKIDGAFVGKSGRVVLFDTKTKGAGIAEDDAVALLAHDFQMGLYAYALAQEGTPPQSCLHNVIRRPQSGGGGFGPRRTAKESLAEWLGRLAEDVAKRPDEWFRRLPYTFDGGEIETFRERCLLPRVAELQTWADGGPHWLNPAALVYGFAKSDMWPLIVNNDRSSHYRRTKPFPELEGDAE